MRQRVSIFKVVHRKDGRREPWIVRWTVSGAVKPFSEPFTSKKGAERYRATLIQAEADGVRFDAVIGLPVSTARSTSETMATWSRAYLAETWGTAAPNTRRTIGPALVWAVERSIRDGAPKLTPELHKEVGDWLREPQREPSRSLAAWLRWSPNLAEMDKAALYELDRRLRLRTGGPGEPLGEALGKEAAGKNVKVTRKALDRAVAKGLLVANPWPVADAGEASRQANRPETTQETAVILTPAQAKALLAAIPTHQPSSRAYQAMAGVGLYAGARPSECVVLSVEDFDLPASGWGSVRLNQAWRGAGEQWGKPTENIGRPKTTKRAVPIPPLLVELTKAWMNHSGITTGPLFLTRSGGRPTSSNYRRALAAAAKRAGVPVPSPYDLRHTYASWASDQGMPIAELSRRLGDKIATVQEWYIHMVEGSEARANVLMDQYYAAG